LSIVGGLRVCPRPTRTEGPASIIGGPSGIGGPDVVVPSPRGDNSIGVQRFDVSHGTPVLVSRAAVGDCPPYQPPSPPLLPRSTLANPTCPRGEGARERCGAPAGSRATSSRSRPITAAAADERNYRHLDAGTYSSREECAVTVSLFIDGCRLRQCPAPHSATSVWRIAAV
jgi:hypothetical protein